VESDDHCPLLTISARVIPELNAFEVEADLVEWPLKVFVSMPANLVC